MFKAIRLFFLKWKTIRKLEKDGFMVTAFEWGPFEGATSDCVITPKDGFDHKRGTDCMCAPTVTPLTLDSGLPYNIIRHQEMGINL
jgi:hypothetical protein